MKRVCLFALLTVGLAAASHAQNLPAEPVFKKTSAVRISQSPKIDGLLDDEVWKNIPVATGFVELRPQSGRKERNDQRTEVRIAYDNTAIYVSARMFDSRPDSIARELAARDQVGNSDFFGIIFDTYQDKMNGSGFFVTAAGSQFDAKYSNGGNEDSNWNAVWESNVKIDDAGWTAEMKIPYSALRFSSKDVQTWGLNMIRKRQSIQQQLFWNPLDPNKNGFINQEGSLEGISNIKAPVRLSFSPYVSSYVNNYPYNKPGINNTSGSFNGGMDIKYGINQSFTLDMTLVPDFGQVQSDKQILNLTPFETQFNENRQFFTEGTELFSKGDLFYSRRIGSNPFYLGDAGSAKSERVAEYPNQSKLLNATKISGRTAKGLGIGFFNALTNRMQATVEDTITGRRRVVETQPLTNYNIVVLDQSLKNNSSVSFVNTNVLRQGSVYDANVSALDFNLNDKKNKWNLQGTGRMSYLSGGADEKGKTGYSYDLKFGKQSGKFVYNFLHRLTDDRYEQNDLGLMFNNNFFDNSVFGEINLFKLKKFNELHTFVQIKHSQRYKPRAYQNFGIYHGLYVQFKNLWSLNWNIDWQAGANDFYESRSDVAFKRSAQYGGGFQLNTNRSKPYNAGVFAYLRAFKQFGGRGYDLGFYQNLRLSNKFSIGNDFSYEPRFNYAGWAGKIESENQPDRILFSRFNRHTVENSIDAKYSFNTKMGITLAVRHYWSTRQNKDFYDLKNNGQLTQAGGVTNKYDRNFNTFNVDMSYVWQFAPGSELTVAWKDASLASENHTMKGYGQNFDHILSAPQNNTLSMKVLYYIDYLQLRKKH